MPKEQTNKTSRTSKEEPTPQTPELKLEEFDVPQEQVEVPQEYVLALAVSLQQLLQSRQLPVMVYTEPNLAAAVRNLDLRALEGMDEALAAEWDNIKKTIAVISSDQVQGFQLIGAIRAITERVLQHYSNQGLETALQRMGIPPDLFMRTPSLVELVAAFLIALEVFERAKSSKPIIVPTSQMVQ